MTDTLNINAYAKINLTLDIIKKLESGYHEIESIKQQLKLHDNITLSTLNEKNIIINCKEVKKEKNLAYKAALLLQKKFNPEKGAEITIKKNIPISSGLAGGSTDAAATLKGLNKLWNLGLKRKELMEIGKEIGMDVPFCILGKTALATGKGIILRRLRPIMEFNVLLINPGFKVSTKQAYEKLDLENTGKRHSTEEMEKAIECQKKEDIITNLHNDFEFNTIKEHPIITEIKKEIIRNGAANALMSGSGPTIFGIFEDEEKAKKAYEVLKDKYKFVCLTKTR